MSHAIEAHDVWQGSEEWHRVRAGCITASNVSMVRNRLKSGTKKGEYSEAAMSYAFRLAVERISGEPLDTDEYAPWQGERGKRLEEEAMAEHELVAGRLVERVGFLRTSDGKFGASADGFIGDDGGAEYKCFLQPEKVRALILDRDVSVVNDQCQFNMAISGRAWWHLCLYVPALRCIDRHFTLIEVKRDDAAIDAIWDDLLKFDLAVEAYVLALRGVNSDKPHCAA